MGHNHESHCHHEHKNNLKGMLIVLILTAFYMIVEFIGGYYTNSLALTADAGHMLGDVGALGLSLFALWLVQKTKALRHSNIELVAAFINGIALVIIALTIIYEAYLRIIMTQRIDAISMTVIAFGGLLVNIIGAKILHSGSKENLNIKGAFLHVIGDLLGSIGAIVAGLSIYFWHFYLADPIISTIIAILVLYSSLNLIISTLKIWKVRQ